MVVFRQSILFKFYATFPIFCTIFVQVFSVFEILANLPLLESESFGINLIKKNHNAYLATSLTKYV